jgi:hypothetical protein
MLIASVQLLHKKWRQVASDLAAPGAADTDRCFYHEIHPRIHGAPPVQVAPALAEVEEDHAVGCIRPYVKGAC